MDGIFKEKGGRTSDTTKMLNDDGVTSFNSLTKHINFVWNYKKVQCNFLNIMGVIIRLNLSTKMKKILIYPRSKYWTKNLYVVVEIYMLQVTVWWLCLTICWYYCKCFPNTNIAQVLSTIYLIILQFYFNPTEDKYMESLFLPPTEVGFHSAPFFLLQ